MKEKIEFNKFIKKWGVIFLISVALLLISIEAILSFSYYKSRVEKTRELYVTNQKSIVKQQVEQVVNLINYRINAESFEKNIIPRDTIKKRLLEIISKIRFGKGGYIFVNRFNGDALVFNGKVLPGTEKLWDAINSKKDKMKKLFQMEYDAAQKPNGDFIYYSFIKLNDSNTESPKVSFICGVPSLQWIVGSGVYLDDIEEEVSLLKGELYDSFVTKLIYTVVILGVAIILLLFLLNILLHKLENDLNKFFLFFQKSSIQNEPINLSEIRFYELAEVGKCANKMLQDKNDAQQKLLDEREQLLVTIHSIGDALITTDKSGKIKLMNSVAENLLGWSLVEAKDKYLAEIFNIVNAQTGKAVNNPVNKVLESGKIVGLANHTKLISKDGNEYQISDSAAPIKNSNGDILGVVLVFRNVTEEYEIQKTLKESVEKFKALFNGINDAIFVQPLLKEGFANFIEVNDVACKRLEYTKDELLTMSAVSIADQDDANFENREKILKEKWSLFESIHITKSGKKIPVEISSRLFNFGGKDVIISLARDISERILADRKLKESEEQFYKVFETSPDPISISSIDGKYINVNNRFCEIVGYTRNEVIGKKSIDINVWESLEVRELFKQELIQKGKVHNMRANFRSKNGKIIPALISATVLDFNGAKAILSLSRDITDIKEATKALQQSENRYKRIADLTYEGILIHKGGIVIDVNSALERISGYTAKELIGTSIFEIIKNEDKNIIMANMENNVTLPYEARGVRKDGKIIDLEIESRNYDNEGTRVTAVRDISQRKKNETEILKLSNAIEQSPVSIVIIDVDGNIEYVNPRFSKTTGYSFNEALSQDLRVLISDEQPSEFYKELWETISDGKEWTGEFKNKKKNGDIFWERAVVSPIKDKSGKIVHFMAIKENISENKKMMFELVKAKEKAENANKMKSIFLAQMSHEIRTPINTLISTMTLLKYDFEDSADNSQMESFEIMDRAGNRIIRTVELLISLAEVQAGTYEVDRTKMDIYSDILATVITESRVLAKINNVELNLTSDTRDTEFVADFSTVTQIFKQLIDNAIKYTKDGKVTVKIFRNELEQLVVEVIDTGIGIANKYIPKIFEPFSQEEMGYTRSYDGNGLGLTLVKTYCELNNAQIEIESEKGVGSTFRVTFR